MGWDMGRGASRGGKPEAAQDLANAPRGKVKLADVVQSPVPELELKGITRPLRPGERPPAQPQ